MGAETKNHYVVIFTSVRSKHQEGYDEMDQRTYELVEKQEGYLGSESYSNEEGKCVTIIKFDSKENIRKWKDHSVHKVAQEKGRNLWYDHYNVKICKVEREYEFNRENI